LGVGDKVSTKEIAAAFKDLQEKGEIERIIRENSPGRTRAP